ncbi:DUF6443 domain-containing protein [Ekhidna sp.]|uniref:Ig-like domain-containing protein n=1 Tax=Ekhidna sp. TaxID=2608089 RepID=UPI0032977123
MPSNKLKIFLQFMFFTGSIHAAAQSISGPTAVGSGDTEYYSISGVDANLPNWTVTSGASIDSQSSFCIGGDYCATIDFTSSGYKTITFKDGNSTIATLSVTVSPPPPAQPSATTTTSHPWCGSTTITRTNGPPAGVRWYWQTTASGTSTLLGYGSNITRDNSGPIYLRARTASGPYAWSDFSQNISYPYSSIIPSLASGSNQSRCGTGSVTLTASPGSNGNTIRWYTASSGGSLVHTGTSFTTPSLSVTKNYYAATYNSTTKCIDSDRKLIKAIINPIPSLASGSNQSRCGTGSVTLTASSGSNGNTIRWYSASSGGSVLHTGSSFTTPSLSSNKTYYAASYNSSTGCQDSDRKAITVIINLIPSLASGIGNDRCGTGTVTLSAAPGSNGNSIRWYSAASGGSLLHTGTSLTTPAISSSTTYYAASYNSTTGCTDTDRKALTATINPVPSLASGNDNDRCGSGVVTLTATPGNNGNTIKWYSTVGGGTALHTGTSFTTPSLSSNTTYYATSFNSATLCEDTQRIAITAVINQVPSFAGAGDQTRCGTGTVTLSGLPGSGGNTIRWYDSATGGTLLHTGTTYTTPSLTTTTTYHAASYSNVTGCEDADRLSVDAIISEGTNPGTLSGATEKFGVASGTVTLGGTIIGDVTKWQYKTTGAWIDTLVTTTSLNYVNIQQPTQFRVMVKNNVCDELPSNAVLIDILNVPELDLGVSQSLRPAGSTTLETTGGHSNYRWFRDSIEIQNGSSNQLVVDKPGTYKVTVTATGGDTSTTGDAVISSQLAFNLNAVLTYFYKTPTTSVDDPFTYNLYEQSISVQILDGIGRPLQQVSLNASPLEKDVVVPFEYDEYGRSTKNHLSYVDGVNAIFKTDALTNQTSFYAGLKGTDKAYSETFFEPSPLNRPLEQGAPGSAWQLGQNTVKFQYDIADSAEVLKLDHEVLLGSSSAVYGPDEIYKNTTTDEDGNQTIEYTNKQGQTIVKKSQVDGSTWAETHYIYDIYGQLSAVLPPEAVAQLSTGFFGQSEQTRKDFLNTWAFLYDYDGRNRMIMKKVPGADSVFMVYDTWDRLVLTQDGVQRQNSEWLFTKYDQLNRPIITGQMTGGSEAAERTAVAASTVRFDTLNTSLTNEYSNQSYPTTGIDEYLTVTYYDNYDWDTTGLSFTNPIGLTMNAAVKGQATGTLTKTGSGIGSLPEGWIKSVSYYDDRYRLIQSQSTNHLGGTDVVTNHYDFIGQVTRTISSHNDGAKTTEIARTFDYDHAGRLLNTHHELSEDVAWTDLEGTVADGNELEKTNTSGWGNGGAASTQMIGNGKDGKLEFDIESNYAVFLGFSETNANANFSTIDYAVYVKGDWNLAIFENGNNLGIVGTYTAGDVITIERVAGVVNYKKNGTVLFTSSNPSIGSLIADVALNGINDKIVGGKITYEKISLAENHYNELGELIEKDLHGGEQSLDYSYNIRGWLTSMNSSDLSASPDGDLFGMELLYDTQDGSLSNTQQYNGNISAMKWSNYDPQGESIDERAYAFGYDKLNRLEAANHFQDNASTNKYGVQGLNYDLNGNIESLQRRAQSTSAFMDDLSYTYTGNQLQKVSDAASDTTGFYDGYTGSIDYAYDANGNMVKDRNKGIDSIYYNHLNLPIIVDFENPGDSIVYLYDAAGIKLQQTVYDSGIQVKVTDYIGEFIYEDGEIQLIQHEEGRIVPEVEKIAEDIVWTFDSDTEGFTATGSISGFQQNNGSIEGTIDVGGAANGVNSTTNLDFDASEYNQIRIRMEVNSSATNAKVYFNRAGESWNSNRSKSFSIETGNGYHEYVVDMASLNNDGNQYSDWTGIIKEIRIIPAEYYPGSFKIDEVMVTGNSVVENYDYQYHLKDHLGNVRLTFSTTPENYTMVETFETGGGNGFQDLHIETKTQMNTTQPYGSSNKVELLTSGQTGAMIFIGLNKGDTIDLTVNANFVTYPSANNFLSTVYNTLFNTFDTNFGSGQEGGVSSTSTVFDDALSSSAMSQKSNENAPRAFLNYIIFDKEMSYVTAGFQQISSAAKSTGPNTSETLSIDDIIADQEGYILAYLSNENQEAFTVHFDDFSVYHGKTNVVSTQDYYPFGLTFNESSRTASKPQKFLLSGNEKQEDWGVGVFDFNARTYDATIGRFYNVDPLSDKRSWVNPYNYVQNNPMLRVDPTGMIDWVENKDGKIYWDENATSQETTKEGEKYLGKNVIVATHNRESNGSEEINSAQYDLYLESDKTGPSATMDGSTVSADISEYGTLAEGVYDAKAATRGNGEDAILVNEGGDLPTTSGNPNNPANDGKPESEHIMNAIWLHSGNSARKSLSTFGGDAISAGCLTGPSCSGSKATFNSFMDSAKDFNGKLYLRGKPSQSTQKSQATTRTHKFTRIDGKLRIVPKTK